MALSPGGQLFVAFTDNRETESYVYLQKFTFNPGSGTYNRSWDHDVKVAGQPGSANPELRFTPGGQLYLAWDDMRSGNSDVFLRQIDTADGSLLGSEWALSHDAGTGAQKNPSMDTDQDGNFYIAWEDYRDGSWDIYEQKFTPAAPGLWGSDYKVSVSVLGEQMNAKVLVDRDTAGDGSAANNSYVFWQSNHAGSFEVYLSKFDKDHVPVFAERQINEDGGSLGQYEPAAAYDGTAAFYVAWTDDRNAQPDIYMQKIDKNGNRLWAGDKEVNDDSFASARRTLPTVAYGGDAAIYISWQDTRNGEAYSDIYTSKVDQNGARQWTYDLIVSDYLASMQTNATTLVDSGGKAVTVWQDDRSGTEGIFAGRYSEMGNQQRAGIPITVTSDRIKGTYLNPDFVPESGQPEYFSIPKYSQTFTSDGSGIIALSGMEWGSYTFSTALPNTIVSYDLPAPISVTPGGNSHIVINVDP
jgi:hypothetical protein